MYRSHMFCIELFSRTAQLPRRGHAQAIHEEGRVRIDLLPTSQEAQYSFMKEYASNQIGIDWGSQHNSQDLFLNQAMLASLGHHGFDGNTHGPVTQNLQRSIYIRAHRPDPTSISRGPKPGAQKSHVTQALADSSAAFRALHAQRKGPS